MRIGRLRASMKKVGVDAVLIETQENVRYYSGFSGENTQLLITKSELLLFTDFRYTEQAGKQTDFEVVETKGENRKTCIFDSIKKAGAEKLGIDLAGVLFATYKNYLNYIDEKVIVDISSAIGVQRCVKDSLELDAISKGAMHNDLLFDKLSRMIRVGVSENDIKSEIVYYMNKNGADIAFDPIVASGKNSCLPHAQPTDRKFAVRDFITMDYGCKFDGYCSDFTRTVAIGEVDKEQQKVYDIVKKAGQKATIALGPGKKCSEIDAIARDYIAKSGYGKYFGHGLGHGVGLKIHEAPSLNATSEVVLEEGMAVTIEPGIYIPGKYGVRIEDLCIITDGGYKDLTTAPRDMIII